MKRACTCVQTCPIAQQNERLSLFRMQEPLPLQVHPAPWPHACTAHMHVLGCKKRPAEHEGGDVESTALLMLLLLLQRHCIAQRFRVEKGFSPFHSGACIEAVKNAASRSKPGRRLSANHML